MEKPASQLVEEAVNAVKKGEISLETGASRFGAAWIEIKSEVVLILDLEEAGQNFKTQFPAPNLDKIWSGILPDLTLIQILPLTGKAATSIPAQQSGTLSLLETEGTPAPKVVPLQNVASRSAPANVSFFKKWRKPLSVAAAICLIALLSMGSLVGVASASAPGDFFYGAKLWLDGARQVVAFSQQDKVNATLPYCDHRSEEIEWLARNNRLEYIPLVAGDYQQNLRKIVTPDNTALTSDQNDLIKAQQTRLAQLTSQLVQKPAANPANVTQASQELDKLVQQLDMVRNQTQVKPTPTVIAVTPRTGPTGTPSVSPTNLSVTPAISGTVTITGTASITGTVSISITAPAGLTRTPGVTPTGSAQTPISVGVTQVIGTTVVITREIISTAPVGSGEIIVLITPTLIPGTLGRDSIPKKTAKPGQQTETGEDQGNDDININSDGNNSNIPETQSNPPTQPATTAIPAPTPTLILDAKSKETKEPKTEKVKETEKPKK